MEEATACTEQTPPSSALPVDTSEGSCNSPLSHRSPLQASSSVEVVIEKDYDGWFERWIRAAIGKKRRDGRRLKHTKFVISAGPMRMYDAACKQDEHDPRVLRVDFYSMCRFYGGPPMDEVIDDL